MSHLSCICLAVHYNLTIDRGKSCPMEEARIFISLIFQTVVVICNISKGMGFLYFSLKNLLRKWHIHKHMFWEAFIFISNAGELTLLDGGLFFL